MATSRLPSGKIVAKPTSKGAHILQFESFSSRDEDAISFIRSGGELGKTLREIKRGHYLEKNLANNDDLVVCTIKTGGRKRVAYVHKDFVEKEKDESLTSFIHSNGKLGKTLSEIKQKGFFEKDLANNNDVVMRTIKTGGRKRIAYVHKDFPETEDAANLAALLSFIHSGGLLGKTLREIKQRGFLEKDLTNNSDVIIRTIKTAGRKRVAYVHKDFLETERVINLIPFIRSGGASGKTLREIGRGFPNHNWEPILENALNDGDIVVHTLRTTGRNRTACIHKDFDI